ncbi:MAG: 6,7-dimethyl-8-ribityllumazine synthase [Candidatus Eisenbacteria bacterium]|uniref:6,7-dimethyl-8-ribityllumazine synthase n=1 Tax=Eiseniibacteriota bacterium TaxID=2212470 RepID=A0A7Y2ECF7_UNCEI|nr:6,7-dimethyl-8-ribityllumazine synthase [Candidatus Eisenbacteria bacterium]
MQEFKGSLDGSNKSFAIVVARFNEAYTQILLDGAIDSLLRLGVSEEDIDVYWVPGSFEVATVALDAARTQNYDGIITLGVLIRGATAHFDLVANQATAGIARVHELTGVPIVFGIVTAENLEQAQERCGTKMGNRGWEAAQSAVELVNLGQAFVEEEFSPEEAEGPLVDPPSSDEDSFARA